jgi:hypothetical protein
MFNPIELIHEWETRTNRLRPRPHTEADLGSHWVRTQDTGEVGLGVPATQLMIVVTTYDRPASAARLLSQLDTALRRSALSRGVALLVLHDACGRDYTAARAQARAIAPRHLWLDARQRFGKAGFWQIHQTAMDVARIWRPERALYLQDDVELDPALLARADALWQATAHDPLRRVLYLFSSRDDEQNGRWVSFERQPVANAPCRVSNWFDLQAFMVDRQFFELLDYRMVQIHPNRWKRAPEKSSGVGRQLTHRLFGRGNVYQAWPPLVAHGLEPSRMNPEARQKRALDNYDDFQWARPRPARGHDIALLGPGKASGIEV